MAFSPAFHFLWLVLIATQLAWAPLARCSPLPIPAAIEPAADTVTCIPTPTFTWQPVDGAAEYQVAISPSEDFAKPIVQGTPPLPRFVWPAALEPGTYFWRVRVVGNDHTKTKFSTPRRFEIKEPSVSFDIPDGADASTIASIVAQAISRTPASINFAPNGNYRLNPASPALLMLKNAANLVINGNGASITFTRPNASLAFIGQGSRNVLIRDLTVDFDPVPFTVGTVVGTKITTDASGRERAFFLAKVDPGMPRFNAEHMLTMWTWGALLDSQQPGRLKTGAPFIINTRKETMEISGDTFSLQLSDPSQLRYFEPGDKYVQFARDGGGSPLLNVTDSENITVLNVTNYAISTGHYEFRECSDVKILGCRSLVKEGRWFGGNADGIHIRANRIGPWVEGCTFEGVGDDGAALYTKGIAILKQESPTTLRLGATFCNLRPGDEFLIFDPASGQPVAERLTVTSISSQQAGDAGLSVAHYKVEFSPPLAAKIQPTDGTEKDAALSQQVFNRSSVNRGFMLRNNTFRNIRRYGSVIRAEHGAIVGNHYSGISDVPIILRNEPDFWRNGLQSSDILIQGNTISDSGFTPQAQRLGQIHAALYRLGDHPSPWLAHHDIRILGNSISQWNWRGISIESTSNVLIKDNTFDSGAKPHEGESKTAIFLNRVKNAEVIGNRIKDSRPHTEILQQSETEDITVQGNSISGG